MLYGWAVKCSSSPNMARAAATSIAELSVLSQKPRIPRPTPLDALPTVNLRGARLHALSEAQCVRFVLNELDQRRGGSILTMNLDHLRRFSSDHDYAAHCRRATILTADGMPLIWASRLLGTPLPERVTGSNLIWSLTAAAAGRRRSVYLLGGSAGVAQKAAEILSASYPGLQVCGYSDEHIDLSRSGAELQVLTDRLVSAAPDIVYVALGSPKQEQLIDRLRARLPHSWWLGVGIAFSFVSGEIRRAPLWMQRGGLEWMHRLAQEPSRLARRYLVSGVPFAATLLCGAALARLGKTQSSNR